MLQNWACDCCVITPIYWLASTQGFLHPRPDRNQLGVSHRAIYALLSSSFLPNPKTSNWFCTSFQAISTLFASENQTSQLQEPTQPRQSPVNSTLKSSPRRKLWALLLRICLNCNHSATSTLRAAIAQQAQWELYGQLSGPAACLKSHANTTPAAAFQQRYN